MRSSEVYLSIAVGLAISLFVLSIFYTHGGKDALIGRFASIRDNQHDTSSGGGVHPPPLSTVLLINEKSPMVSSETPSAVVMAGGLEIKPVVIHSTLKQRQFPNMRGVATSSDFLTLMHEATKQPAVTPQKRQKTRSTESRQTAVKLADSVSIGLSGNLTCVESLPTTCKIYPYLRFWNKKFSASDCYHSPLRPLLKEKAPLSDQKFVVFEPDRGGWSECFAS
jgi:hypothetical protein